MFYRECYKCEERWELGTASTCKCETEVKWDASAPLVMTPHPAFQKRTWVGLTEEEHYALADKAGCMSADWVDYAKAIAAKLKEKNHV